MTGIGNSDAWCSAEEVTIPLEQFFGGPVHTDPCSNEFSIVKAVVKYTYGGLHRPWGKTTYENPPYSKSGTWTDRAINEMRVGNVQELVRLTMVSTSTGWWHRQCWLPRRNPRLLFTRRLKFYDPFAATAKVTKMGARFDTVLTYYGPRVVAFESAFRHLTRWTAWGR